jgi:2-polyprenyl-3-methyl-5-hydroxy-6-metoxy-1,4-benzoquinol methylase
MSQAAVALRHEETEPGLTETVPCPLCGSGSYDVLRPARYPEGMQGEELLGAYRSSSDHIMMDQLARCRDCRLAYLNPRVRADIILSSYAGAIDPVFVKQNPLRIRTFRKSLAALMERYGIAPSREKQVLDIGCAGGAFPKAASDLGFTAVGVEPSAWLCEWGRREYGLDLRAGTLADHRFPAKGFFLATLWDVIEHLTDPAAVLAEAHRVLADDGLLVVNFPDYDSWARRLMGFRWPFFLSVHLIYFNRATITRMLERAGFEVLEVRPFWQTLEAGYVAHRASAYFTPFAWVEKALGWLGLAQAPLTYQLGQSMAVARKRQGAPPA